uniref:Kinesin motor domain-containing protein n=1 Tax=Kalanchoe fedtschenkoi TaxID=63787 RepID=A0A7N0UPR4_KALFE
MEISETKGNEKDLAQCVRVAVNVRPLITSELLIGCTDCITVVPGEPQVQIGSHAFTFDYVYGAGGSPSSLIFSDCVAPLVDALFHGYNATVLAYGQTGSGKTYTMGTNYTGEDSNEGIIPKVMETIFSRVEAMKDSSEFLIRVSFIEIFKEDVFDLLDHSMSMSHAKSGVPSRVPIQIRETANGGITLSGVTEAEVRKKEEMASYLSRGSLARATGSTNMNSQSSRSHAIFTISMEQKRSSQSSSGSSDDLGDDILSAKLHLVDLAGSERAKRTGADGLRLKEGIHINKGLLALGNVISALGDEKKRNLGGHVPYRDSKLTRLLQDSLGGNSKTLMIACVSPADTNAEETLNTLKYANRARNIQNKAVINRDPAVAQMQKMRSQIEQLQSELLIFRGDSSAPFEELQILKRKISLLEDSNMELQRELKQCRLSCEQLAQRAIGAQVEKDKLLLKIESAKSGKSWDEIETDSDQNTNLLQTYVSKIQELEGELQRVQCFRSSKRSRIDDCLDTDDERHHSKHPYLGDFHEFQDACDTKGLNVSDEIEATEKELEHTSLQEKLDMELKELDKQLEQKEAEMKRFGNVETSVLKHHYEKKVQELEHEKRSLQREIEDLRQNLSGISTSSDDGAKRLKEEYLQKLNLLEAQVAELKKKQDAQAQLLRQKQKSDEAAKRLQDEIQKMKTQKVQLQQKIKHESEQFRLWKAMREKEVLQLRKEGRRNEYEMHKLVALNQRQKMVLQRKTEEAAMATKRLKELLEARKASSRGGNGPGIQAIIQILEHELEVVVRVHEVRAEYDRQMEERARMAKEVARLKEEEEMLRKNNISMSPQMMSPGARNSRIFALENMLATSSSSLIAMASELSEASEDREKVLTGKGRWNQVRTLPEAKNLLNHLFNLTSSSRCLLRDREVDCREKDAEIKELKDKIVALSSLVRQQENQKAELVQKLNAQRLASMYEGGHNYHLRNSKGLRSSLVLLEDMDTSESDHGDMADADDDDGDWVQSGRKPFGKRNSKNGSRSSIAVVPPTDICCSCSKKSSCKLTRCECRAAGGTCGPSCGCVATKCTNRDISAATRVLDTVKSDTSDESKDVAEKENAENHLVSQGAMLLQNALGAELSAHQDGRRKPLSDIGNTAGKSNVPKPGKRKNWRKSVIQLVPVAPPSTDTATNKPENSTPPIAAELPLRPSRAMQSASMQSSNLLRERNIHHADESNAAKDDTNGSLTSRQPKATEEKENHK